MSQRTEKRKSTVVDWLRNEAKNLSHKIPEDRIRQYIGKTSLGVRTEANLQEPAHSAKSGQIIFGFAQ